jgi:hypothetical protein
VAYRFSRQNKVFSAQIFPELLHASQMARSLNILSSRV